MQQEIRLIKYRQNKNNLLAIILRFFGFNLYTRWTTGYYHKSKYFDCSSTEKHGIAIIETETGKMIAIPNNSNYYKFI